MSFFCLRLRMESTNLNRTGGVSVEVTEDHIDAHAGE
jgi:hypothetical protein